MIVMMFKRGIIINKKSYKRVMANIEKCNGIITSQTETKNGRIDISFYFTTFKDAVSFDDFYQIYFPKKFEKSVDKQQKIIYNKYRVKERMVFTMKNISVIIDYATISPAVLDAIIGKDLLGWCWWQEIDEDSFEFWVRCRQEDAAGIERKLAQYV